MTRTARYISLLEGNVDYNPLKDAFFLTRTGTTGETGTLAPYAKIKTTPKFSLEVGDGNDLCTLIDYHHKGFDGKFLINCANHKPYVIFTPTGIDPIVLGGGKPDHCNHDHHHDHHHDHNHHEYNHNHNHDCDHDHNHHEYNHNQINNLNLDENFIININCEVHHGHHDDCMPNNQGIHVDPAINQNADFYIDINYVRVCDHHKHHDHHNHHDHHHHDDIDCGILETSIFNVVIPLSI